MTSDVDTGAGTVSSGSVKGEKERVMLLLVV